MTHWSATWLLTVYDMVYAATHMTRCILHVWHGLSHGVECVTWCMPHVKEAVPPQVHIYSRYAISTRLYIHYTSPRVEIISMTIRSLEGDDNHVWRWCPCILWWPPVVISSCILWSRASHASFDRDDVHATHASFDGDDVHASFVVTTRSLEQSFGHDAHHHIICTSSHYLHHQIISIVYSDF